VNQTHKKWLVIVFSLVMSLACSMFPVTSSPTATPQPDTNSEIGSVPTVEGYIDSTVYTTGIEITQVIEVPGVIDHNGKYALTLPKNWVLGALHSDFASTVEKESQVNESVKGLFDYFLKTDPNIRAFGFSTSPTQLNKDSFLVAVVKMFQDNNYSSRNIDELADIFIANQSSPELVNFTYRSEPLSSALDIPTVIMLNEVQDGKGNIAIYNGILLAKLESAYVQVFFLTNNPEINLGDELAYPASSIMNYDK